MLQVVPYGREHLPAIARLFRRDLIRLRRRVPALPSTLTEREPAETLLRGFLTPERALVALADGEPVGYLGWALYERFRGAARRAAYSPEFGHAASAGRAVAIQRALYRVASARWDEAGCQIHALTSLAGGRASERFWFESGFGMLVQDALRPLTPIGGGAAPAGVTVRRAAAVDAAVLARLDRAHRRHYAAAPVLMVHGRGDTAAAFEAFLGQEPNTIWLAEGDRAAQAFLRCEPESDGAVRVSLAPTTISITGAYTRPAWRGRGVGTALLAAATAHYAARGFERMAVDYETINPEALAFWPRYFDLVAVSYLRYPERS
ncbi:MAG: GNAT family N-acetyltransferase [Candidatus Limnocylindrales bacterium]